MTLVFTLCSNNYLAQAVTLGKSLLQHNPHYIFKIGLVDKKNPQIEYSVIPYDIIEVEDISIPAFDEMFKRYNITELNTAVKPYYFQYFFETCKAANKFIFLDPDILVYRPFAELEEALKENDIIITPHLSTPINDDKILDETDFLNSGLYNLGFLALKRGRESQKFLEWWAKRLETKAYINFARGLFTDQIWINFVPLFFKNVLIFCHPGYNMAYWNMHERSITEGKEVIFGGTHAPLIFFHFSGYNPLQPGILSKYQNRFSFENRSDVSNLFKEYTNLILRNGLNYYIKHSSYYVVEKEKTELAEYIAYKKTLPIYKRMLRGIILRFISWFKINAEYYTH